MMSRTCVATGIPRSVRDATSGMYSLGSSLAIKMATLGLVMLLFGSIAGKGAQI